MSVPLTSRTRLVPATPENIVGAADVLRGGGLVAFPTETVYGLGAAAEQPAAVRAMFAAKGRPPDHPVIVHLADADRIDEWAVDIPPSAHRLAEAFWPGPMTLVLRRSKRASDLVTGGLETVGLRVPGHPVAQALLLEFDEAIAAPSANRFGRVSPTTAQHVLDELHGRIPLILDGGACSVGLESTIIDLSGERPAILRPGAVTAEQVAAVLNEPIAGPHAAAPRVSGSLASHYAPRARVELVAWPDLARRAAELAAAGQRVAVVVRGGREPNDLPPGEEIVVIRLPLDEMGQAHELYAALRQVDALHCHVALATPPQERGLGTAIADRLRRAAGPREHETPSLADSDAP